MRCTWGSKSQSKRELDYSGALIAGLAPQSRWWAEPPCRGGALRACRGPGFFPARGAPLCAPTSQSHPWKGVLVLSLWERGGCRFPRHLLADSGFGSSNTVSSSSFIYGWIASPGCPENPGGFPVVSLPVYVGSDSRRVTVVQRGRQRCLKSAGRAGS